MISKTVGAGWLVESPKVEGAEKADRTDKYQTRVYGRRKCYSAQGRDRDREREGWWWNLVWAATECIQGKALIRGGRGLQ